MLKQTDLILGGVYLTKWDERPFRVLAFDDLQVFYDCYWPQIDKWTFGNLKRTGYYYTMSVKNFTTEAKFLKEQPLSSIEFETFRPDLPIRICRVPDIAWTNVQYPDIETYKQSILGQANFSDEIVVPLTQISLHPFGPNSGSPKSSIVVSESEQGFTCIDLLWKAQNIQSSYIREPQPMGVGIYRLGHKNKMPAYYIAGYYDKAGILQSAT